ncbi:putative protein serine/threonine kinase [Cavenderia fasciculata]|uniref:non-specific serine/threonine protein kinase n=1 Tax=Cavenderia fasciculata TaxID=261658 RepID=F4PMG2_CACFS|nr:putative protein serine/threonine kinase [Cavenderia fasciculata]EGG23609.1 putative protein serine/threonine kinase [Cavenderia fasciculata]|eukprot:XP_004361460.1 putative protein serine/threonine kinase [Cavenderia fasciculata]
MINSSSDNTTKTNTCIAEEGGGEEEEEIDQKLMDKLSIKDKSSINNVDSKTIIDNLEDSTTTTTTTTKVTLIKEKDFNSEEMIEHHLNQQSKQQLSSNKKNKEDFNFIRTIGKGSYGKVKLVIENSTGYLYAAKILNKQLILKEKKSKYVNSEKTILDSLDHPNIIKLFYTFQDESNLYFIIEYCPNGDLLDLLKRSGNCFQLDVVRFYSAEILLTIEYLHSRGICHRDIKPENILLSKSMHTKLSDFGTAKVIHNERSGSFCGTAEYVCPELLVEKMAGKSADIWSELTFPESFDGVARSLVDRILCLDPNDRPSFNEIKAHPFFKGVVWQSLNDQTPPQVTVFEPISPQEDRQRSKSVGSPNIINQLKLVQGQTNQQQQQQELLPTQQPSGGGSGTAISSILQRERSTTTSSVQQSPMSRGPNVTTSSPLSPLPLISSPPQQSSNNKTSELPKSYQPTIYITPTELLLQGKPKMIQLLQEQSTLVWNKLLLPNDEIILGMTPIVKKTGLISKQRHLIITDSPRIFWVDSSKMIIKGEIHVDLTLLASIKSNKHFTITSRGRTRHFNDTVTQDSKRWVDLINNLKLLGSLS